MVTWIWVNIVSSNGLLPDSTKPLPKPMLRNSMSPYGVTKPQWINLHCALTTKLHIFLIQVSSYIRQCTLQFYYSYISIYICYRTTGISSHCTIYLNETDFICFYFDSRQYCSAREPHSRIGRPHVTFERLRLRFYSGRPEAGWPVSCHSYIWSMWLTLSAVHSLLTHWLLENESWNFKYENFRHSMINFSGVSPCEFALR